jgi:hypothetical protein
MLEFQVIIQEGQLGVLYRLISRELKGLKAKFNIIDYSVGIIELNH